MVSVVSDPSTAWRRILLDVSRIADWARRKGNDEQKAGAQKLIASLNEFAPLFDLTLMAPNLSASIVKPIDNAKLPDEKPRPQSGFVAFMRGVAYDDCPYADGTEEAAAWCKGWITASKE